MKNYVKSVKHSNNSPIVIWYPSLDLIIGIPTWTL